MNMTLVYIANSKIVEGSAYEQNLAQIACFISYKKETKTHLR